ncbi:type II toxin-antitoxin system HicA family toxin [Myroides odoratimimus]|uniref:Uncharacterized protein n=3 Tax=Flavobacteriaceae TaxID=49546 RepID=A0A0U3G821_9FLAO|nr:hypothetical protein [Myroides odoratimimus]AJA67509.1 hypothetical protein MYRA21_0272 [Myroides sp. A21]EHO09158.1 hypothetical protein HMPREF9712_01939 [Myroides odoratimimus CCUG 10230]ALU24792.1 hypothetical protein AS202_00645 [Myroides odoratimimus]MCA4793391.1 type II toxin-antitoxin system HicA family toxin [Myroides odoratimimus]MCA4820652.1 type II toxin-antitoxin system HicA family toxin [Myroides odoratimimus]
MNTYKLSNIPLKTMCWFIEHNGCKDVGGIGGHKKYVRKDLTRPIIIQSHIDPVPEFIVKQILRHLGFDKKQFHEYLKAYY